MSYYAKVLQPDETVKYIGKLHWTIYRNSIVLGLLTVIVALFALSLQQDHRPIVLLGAGILALLTLGSFLGHWFVRVTTEIVVTDKRVIHKTGWILQAYRGDECHQGRNGRCAAGCAGSCRQFWHGTGS